ncbi:hypothetical protein BDV37DRAFT_266842 [Aspergillus pseudonomiae]|uniref:Uncharacterized protein n=1 Tax=Aspergillus pseudonomiae TaxID=1506151 RepID=A0A5N7CTI2_9EURO|nr:uncharacterized protein BDV37DRAFT_266842 [Aspergillus pseudonomiae]KAE8397017.1 hypothetical protein BDV37DRAFT_266842 [Aspergillus pseudonomiae]
MLAQGRCSKNKEKRGLGRTEDSVEARDRGTVLISWILPFFFVSLLFLVLNFNG